MKLCLLSFLFTVTLFAQDFIIDENFEDGIPSTWTILQSNENETWKTQGGYDFFFTNVAVVDSSPDMQDEWLITPSFSLADATSPQLDFIAATNHMVAVQFDIIDLNVHISTDGGNTWDILWEDAEMPWGANYVPFLTSIDLSQYIGETDLQIAFQYEGVDGASFIIDRIWVNANADYCSYYFPDNRIEPITRVAIANLEHTASPSAAAQESHLLFLDEKADVVIGNTYTLELEGVTGWSGMSKFVLFVDWNHDGLMSYEDEMYEIGIIENSTGIDGVKISRDIIIPTNAELGDTRIRIVKISGHGYPEACNTNLYENGQAKDFILRVSDELSNHDFSIIKPNIYPNPVIDILNIETKEDISKILIKDLNGKIVRHQQINNTKIALDIQSLPVGVYVLYLHSKDRVSTHKILKK